MNENDNIVVVATLPSGNTVIGQVTRLTRQTITIKNSNTGEETTFYRDRFASIKSVKSL